MTETTRAAKDLWQDYLFLTHELSKCINREDLDLFYEILAQRERLQHIIDEQPEDGYCISTDGREILVAIQQENKFVMLKLQALLNRGKNQQAISHAYDVLSTAPLGRRMDHQG